MIQRAQRRVCIKEYEKEMSLRPAHCIRAHPTFTANQTRNKEIKLWEKLIRERETHDYNHMRHSRKEFIKAIAAHRALMFEFHRRRRNTTNRLAKAVALHVDKQGK